MDDTLRGDRYAHQAKQIGRRMLSREGKRGNSRGPSTRYVQPKDMDAGGHPGTTCNLHVAETLSCETM